MSTSKNKRRTGNAAPQSEAETGKQREELRRAVQAMTDAGWCVVRFGSRTRVVQLSPDPNAKEPLIQMNKDDFKTLFSNHFVWIDRNRKYVAAEWLDNNKDRPTYKYVEFDPSKPPGATAGTATLNPWRGFSVEGQDNGNLYYWTGLRRHLFENVCRKNPYWFAYAMCWMAHVRQHPAQKPGAAMVVKGRKGTGKTKVAEWLSMLIPNNSISIAKPTQMFGKFNAHHMGKLLVVSEEAFWAGDKGADGAVKHMITGPKNVFEPKGVDAIEVDDFCRLWMCANEDWVVPATKDERRYMVLETSTARAKDVAYFSAIDAQMCGVSFARGRDAVDKAKHERRYESWSGLQGFMHDLKYLKQPIWIELRNPPKTPWLTEQVEHALPPEDAWWMSVIDDGVIRGDKTSYAWPVDGDDGGGGGLADVHAGRRSVYPGTEPGWMLIGKEELWESFQSWRKGTAKGAHVTKEQLCKFVLKMIRPLGGKESRPRGDEARPRNRPRCFTVPPIEALRRAFLKDYGIAVGDVTEETGDHMADDVLATMVPDDIPKEELDAWRAYGEGGPRPAVTPERQAGGGVRFRRGTRTDANQPNPPNCSAPGVDAPSPDSAPTAEKPTGLAAFTGKTNPFLNPPKRVIPAGPKIGTRVSGPG